MSREKNVEFAEYLSKHPSPFASTPELREIRTYTKARDHWILSAYKPLARRGYTLVKLHSTEVSNGPPWRTGPKPWRPVGPLDEIALVVNYSNKSRNLEQMLEVYRDLFEKEFGPKHVFCFGPTASPVRNSLTIELYNNPLHASRVEAEKITHHFICYLIE